MTFSGIRSPVCEKSTLRSFYLWILQGSKESKLSSPVFLILYYENKSKQTKTPRSLLQVVEVGEWSFSKTWELDESGWELVWLVAASWVACQYIREIKQFAKWRRFPWLCAADFPFSWGLIPFSFDLGCIVASLGWSDSPTHITLLKSSLLQLHNLHGRISGVTTFCLATNTVFPYLLLWCFFDFLINLLFPQLWILFQISVPDSSLNPSYQAYSFSSNWILHAYLRRVHQSM